MVKWSLQKMNTETWLPVAEVAEAESIKVKSDANRDGSSPLMQSCDVDLNGRIEEGYYRISKLDGGAPAVVIATMYLIPEKSDWSCGSWDSSVSGKSILVEAADAKFAPGSCVTMGTDAIAWAANLLSGDIPAPVSHDGSYRLADHVVFDLNASHLDGIWQVLDIAGFTMSIAGDGSVSIHKRPSQPSLTVDTSNRSILGCDISNELPIDGVPNVLRVYVNGEQFEAVNDDPSSPTSVVTRGRRIEEVEEDPQMKQGESPLQYAIRRLNELSEVWETYDVTRCFFEGVAENSLVRANLPDQGIEGDFIILSQSIECKGDIEVSETWGRLA